MKNAYITKVSWLLQFITKMLLFLKHEIFHDLFRDFVLS